jgi:hypothetical protein
MAAVAGAAAPKAVGEPTAGRIEQVRAWAGLIAVVAGDTAIALAAILAIAHFAASGTPSQVLPQVVAILSSAFTAIGTMTTAYFGIKAMSNTAKNLAAPK